MSRLTAARAPTLPPASALFGQAGAIGRISGAVVDQRDSSIPGAPGMVLEVVQDPTQDTTTIEKRED
jgi:hypothetical protein